MTTKYGKFELPTTIKQEQINDNPNEVRFIAEPLERGFGHTLGNSLRRIMLTALEAPAIALVKIEGVQHEYGAVEGVIEDMTHIVLNFKEALLRKLPSDEEAYSRSTKKLSKVVEITPQMLESNNGNYEVTLADVVDSGEFELVNPEHKLFTATAPMTRRVDLRVMIGRGYVPSERIEVEDKVVGEIAIDASFSPVRIANYFVENTRVGGDTDFDRVVLEVKTDGRVTPKEALSFATQIGIHHFSIFDSLAYEAISFDDEEEADIVEDDGLVDKLVLRINEIELSVRSTNCLSQANIETIAELVIMPESDMLKFRNFGKKSLNEIKAKLEDMNMYLGMDLSRYGFTRENVKEYVVQVAEERLGREV